MKKRYYSQQIYCVLILFVLSLCLPAQSKDLSGLWISTFGHINLKMGRAKISGDYYDGRIQGNLNGDLSRGREVLIGSWDEGKTQGRFIFKVLSGQNSFSGHWWKADTKNAGDWIAVRMEKEALLKSISASDYQGEWTTNFGKMVLQVEGQTVTGTFKGNVSQGTIEGTVNEQTNQLNAKWADKKYRGTVTLSMLKGKNGFNGEWWYSDKVYGGAWYGVRAVETLGCISGNCDDDEGLYVWPDGSRYEGEWKDGQYNGIGAAYLANGELENQGLWANSVFQGTPLSGDCKNGSGQLNLPGGSVYEGDFKDCELTGKGKFVYPNGDTYEGDVIKGVATGTGTYTWAESGNSYSGIFRNGIIHGKGVFKFRNGDQYEGRFSNGKPDGEGVFTWADGDRYEGQLANNKASGQGSYFYKNGDKYTGNFAEGLKSEKGTYTFASGKSVPAIWEKDRIDRIVQEDSPGTEFVIADYLTEKNKSFREITTNCQAARFGFFIYKIAETETAETLLAADSTRSMKKAVHLEFFIVYGPENLDEAIVRSYLENKNNINLADHYKIEKTLNPESRIQQVLNHYRFSLSKTRIHTSGAYFIYSEDDFAVLK